MVIAVLVDVALIALGLYGLERRSNAFPGAVSASKRNERPDLVGKVPAVGHEPDRGRFLGLFGHIRISLGHLPMQTADSGICRYR